LFSLAGRAVAVTGASRGIGLTISQGLAAAGATVALLSRPSDHLQQAADALGEHGIAVPVDVGSIDSVRGAFERIGERFGRLDVLVNNAAIGWPHRIEDLSDDELMAEVMTNFVGPIITCRSAIPLLRASDDAHIFNISTEMTADPFPYLVLYGAAKAAVEVLTRGLARELTPDRIRCTILRVGRTEGGEFRLHWPADRRAEAEGVWAELGFRPTGAVGQPPERITEAILFALSRPKGSIVDVINVRAH
jgi:NAD(P)-dependent dehydrogenase (short-subunit alcohol dehydrogenase family)